MKRFRSVYVAVYILCAINRSLGQEGYYADAGSGQHEETRVHLPVEEAPKSLGPERKQIEIHLGSPEEASAAGIVHVDLHEVIDAAGKGAPLPKEAQDTLIFIRDEKESEKVEEPHAEASGDDYVVAERLPEAAALVQEHIEEHPHLEHVEEHEQSSHPPEETTGSSEYYTTEEIEKVEPLPQNNSNDNDHQTLPLDIETLKVMAEAVYDLLNHTYEQTLEYGPEENKEHKKEEHENSNVNSEEVQNLEAVDNAGRFKKDLKANHEEESGEEELSSTTLPAETTVTSDDMMQCDGSTTEAESQTTDNIGAETFSNEEQENTQLAAVPLEVNYANESISTVMAKVEEPENKKETEMETESPEEQITTTECARDVDAVDDAINEVQPQKNKTKSSANNLQSLQDNFLYISLFIPVILYYLL